MWEGAAATAQLPSVPGSMYLLGHGWRLSLTKSLYIQNSGPTLCKNIAEFIFRGAYSLSGLFLPPLKACLPHVPKLSLLMISPLKMFHLCPIPLWILILSQG